VPPQPAWANALSASTFTDAWVLHDPPEPPPEHVDHASPC
jgi:hypothetical protein